MSQSEPQNWMTRTGATPGKLALIGVLSLILGYVVLSPLLKRQTATAARTPAASRTPKNVRPAADPMGDTDKLIAEHTTWPKPDIDKVIAYDPFAAPSWARPATPHKKDADATVAAASPEERTVNDLREMGATVIMEFDGEPMALIGERQLRVGDQLDGFRVTQITTSGVVLAKEGSSP